MPITVVSFSQALSTCSVLIVHPIWMRRPQGCDSPVISEFYNALSIASPLSQRRPYLFCLLPDMLIRPTQMNATAKSRWMTANSLVNGRAPRNNPHKSKAAIAANPTRLPSMMAFRALDGSAFRAIQLRTEIPRERAAEKPQISNQRGRGGGGDGANAEALWGKD